MLTGNYQEYYQMLEMSRSIHDILYQGNICMPRRDTDIQLVGTDTQNHAGKREPMQISKSKESDTLLLAVGSHH